jgi:hypothetical protein
MLLDLGNVRNDRLVHEIGRVERFVSDRLFSDTNHDLVSVSVELDYDMVVDGFCTQEDEFDYMIELRPDIRGPELVKTLIHEFVHIWQYVRGDLTQEHIDGLGPRMIWKNEDMSHVNYNDRPWEIEAHRLEEELYRELRKL